RLLAIIVPEAAEYPHRTDRDRPRADEVEQGARPDHVMQRRPGQERERGERSDAGGQRAEAPTAHVPAAHDPPDREHRPEQPVHADEGRKPGLARAGQEQSSAQAQRDEPADERQPPTARRRRRRAGTQTPAVLSSPPYTTMPWTTQTHRANTHSDHHGSEPPIDSTAPIAPRVPATIPITRP